jgi:probable rRNA maturation factor
MRHRLSPPIEVRNVQRAIRVSVRRLQSFAEIACTLVWKHRQPEAKIASVHAISVLIVSDRRMAALHQKFCGTSGPTDVLTFQHGEIVISAETAARQAKVFRSTLASEIRLYLLHGLLHLGGFNDATTREQKRMQGIQNRLLVTALRTNR